MSNSSKHINLDDHHKRVVEALQAAEAAVAEAQTEVKAAERKLTDAQGTVQYYRGKLDMVIEFAQYAQPAPAPSSE
jgi:multidrug resistance efflux pump